MFSVEAATSEFARVVGYLRAATGLTTTPASVWPELVEADGSIRLVLTGGGSVRSWMPLRGATWRGLPEEVPAIPFAGLVAATSGLAAERSRVEYRLVGTSVTVSSVEHLAFTRPGSAKAGPPKLAPETTITRCVVTPALTKPGKEPGACAHVQAGR